MRWHILYPESASFNEVLTALANNLLHLKNLIDPVHLFFYDVYNQLFDLRGSRHALYFIEWMLNSSEGFQQITLQADSLFVLENTFNNANNPAKKVILISIPSI